MRKYFIFLLLSLVLGLSSVSASTTFNINYILDGLPTSEISYAQAKTYFQDNSSIILDMFEQMYSVYSSNFANDYPYYYIYYSAGGPASAPESITMYFSASSTIPTVPATSGHYDLPFEIYSYCQYDFSNSSFTDCENFTTSSDAFTFYYGDAYDGSIYINRIFYSNFDLYFSGLNDFDFVGYEASNINSQRSWLLEASAPIPTMYDFFELTFMNDYDTDTYTEVNLNNYAYIILSLKDYSHLISPVEFDLLGQVCFTPVYNYGQTEKSSGVTDRCSLNYASYTPFRYYIRQQDLDNNAVFYVVPYDITHSNKIKINTRVFNISYITSENASEPVVVINGRSYSALPYSELSSSASINEDNNYIPGQSENIFDISSDSSFITDLFSHPLEALKTSWSSITMFFTIIADFIGLLPDTLQAFLLVAFAIGIILGLLKILL